MNNQKILTVIGETLQAETAHKLFAYQQTIRTKKVIATVPETTAQELLPLFEQFTIVNDRDNDEYVYSAEMWRSLDGSDIRSLRRKVTTFNKLQPNTFLQPLDLNASTDIAFIKRQLQAWPHVFSTNDEDKNEAKILERFFQLSGHLPHYCLGLFVDGALEGFLIYEVLPQQAAAIFNHVKVSYSYRYMFDFLLHKGAAELPATITKINFEQDLGIPGLRLHKQSLKPIDYLKKYTITPVAL